MRPLIALLLALPLLMAQAPGTTPAQPFPNHEEPPSGWYCVPADKDHSPETEAHACSCRGMLEDDPICKTTGSDEEGNPIEMPMGESSKCKVWCHKDHCTCVTRCADSN